MERSEVEDWSVHLLNQCFKLLNDLTVIYSYISGDISFFISFFILEVCPIKTSRDAAEKTVALTLLYEKLGIYDTPSTAF